MLNLYSYFFPSPQDIGISKESEEDLAAMMKPKPDEHDAALESFACLIADLLGEKPTKDGREGSIDKIQCHNLKF